MRGDTGTTEERMQSLVRRFPRQAAALQRLQHRWFTRLFGAPAVPPGDAVAPAAPRRHGMRILIALAALAFYAGFAVWAVRGWDVAALEAVTIHPGWLILAMTIHGGGYAIAVALRRDVMAWLGYPLRWLEHQSVYAYSDLAAKLPGIFLGYLSRIMLYGRLGVTPAAAGAAILLEVVSIGCAGAVLCLALIPFVPALAPFVSWPILLAILAMCIGLTHPRLLGMLAARLPGQQALADALRQLSWRALARLIAGQTLVAGIGGLCLFGVVASVVGHDAASPATLLYVWAFTLVWSLLLAWLPIDLGLRHGPLLIAFAALYPAPIVVVITVVWRIWVNVVELSWALLAIAATLALGRRTPAEESP
jgi:hypothetical protein